jgi:hypothetical protein
LSDAQIVFQNAAMQMPVFAGALGRWEWTLALPAALSAKSVVPDNQDYQECGLQH